MTRFHRQLILAIGAGLLVDGFDVYLASGVAGALVEQGFASLTQVAQLTAVTFMGLGVGGFVCGLLGDRLGRRRTLRWTLAVVLLGSIVSAFAQDMPQLILLRFVTALGLGGETVLGYAMLSEFLPPAQRGRWLAFLGLLANAGMPLALFTGYATLPHPEGWRLMLIIPGLAALAVLYLRRRLPESPRWLVAQGRQLEAAAVVDSIECGTPSPRTSAAEDIPSATERAAMGRAVLPAFRDLFAPGTRRRLLVGSSINVAMMSAVFGFVSWLPAFFVSEGRDIASSVLFAAVMSIGSPFGVFLGLLVTERIERKWGIVLFSSIAALLGVAYAFAATPALIVSSGFLVVTAVYLTGTLGMTGYVPELFPTALRMRGVGFCATMGRIVGIGLPFIIVPVFAAAGQAGVVIGVASILLGQALIVALFGVRTNARSLEAV